jgi:hypothetical protein
MVHDFEDEGSSGVWRTVSPSRDDATALELA